MKIALISINAHTKVLNFASPLHTYVFQQFLLDNGIKTTIVDYKPVYFKNFDVEHPPVLLHRPPLQGRSQAKGYAQALEGLVLRERGSLPPL